MSRNYIRLFPIVILVLFSQRVLAQIPSSPLPSNGQALVLKNGNVIVGLIEELGGNFAVQTSQGSRLVIASEKVDFVAESLQQVYWGRLARIRASDFDSQQKLFYWCLQNELLSEAENQLEVLQVNELAQGRIENLQQRLKQAIAESSMPNRQEIPSSPAQQLPPGTATVATNSVVPSTFSPSDFFVQLDPVFTPLPALTVGLGENVSALVPSTIVTAATSNRPAVEDVLQVGYSEVLNEVKPDHDNSGQLSVHELESFVGELPRGTFGVFRQQIERKLLLLCADCHDSKSTLTTTMPLMHAGKLQPTSRRMTQRNLHSAYNSIDRSDPLASKLLHASVTAHGGGTSAPMSIDSREYENLKNWVVSLCRQPSETVGGVGPESEQPKLLAENTDLVNDLQGTNNPMNHQFSPTIGEIPRLDLAPTGFRPHDEFDPELFNRLYGNPDRNP